MLPRIIGDLQDCRTKLRRQLVEMSVDVGRRGRRICRTFSRIAISSGPGRGTAAGVVVAIENADFCTNRKDDPKRFIRMRIQPLNG